MLKTLVSQLPKFSALAMFGALGANAQCLSCVNQITLPTGPVAFSLVATNFNAGTDLASTGNGYFALTLTGVTTGTSLANQSYAAWCGAWYNSPLQSNGFPGGPVYSTYSSTLPATYAPTVAGNNLNMVNYILNNKQGTVQDVQDAIWTVMTGQTGDTPTATALAMVTAAKANSGFIPNPGGVVAILYQVNAGALATNATGGATQLQNLLFELPVPTSTTQGGGGTGSSSNICGLSPGYWKTHSTWPVTYLTLGDRMYTQAQMLPLLSAPKKGDDSLILAFQLIAAKLNVANGTIAATAGTNITDADALLSGYSKALPYGVKSPAMNNVATNLNAFNNDGQLQPGCKMP